MSKPLRYILGWCVMFFAAEKHIEREVEMRVFFVPLP